MIGRLRLKDLQLATLPTLNLCGKRYGNSKFHLNMLPSFGDYYTKLSLSKTTSEKEA
jgi:hypothetical protein